MSLKNYLIDATIMKDYEPNFPPFFAETPKGIVIDLGSRTLDKEIYYKLPEVLEVNKDD